jgi:hypothetical protein
MARQCDANGKTVDVDLHVQGDGDDADADEEVADRDKQRQPQIRSDALSAFAPEFLERLADAPHRAKPERRRDRDEEERARGGRRGHEGVDDPAEDVQRRRDERTPAVQIDESNRTISSPSRRRTIA